MNTKCFIHIENVDRLVLSSLLASICGIVQSPVDRYIGEGQLACLKQASGLNEAKPQNPLALALGGGMPLHSSTKAKPTLGKRSPTYNQKCEDFIFANEN